MRNLSGYDFDSVKLEQAVRPLYAGLHNVHAGDYKFTFSGESFNNSSQLCGALVLLATVLDFEIHGG